MDPNPRDAIQAIATNLTALRARLIAAGATGLYKAGHVIITDAQQNYVPVRDGILLASGQVSEPVISETDATVSIGFGGAASAYARVQHEDLTFHHEIGGPKYLERPLLAHADDIKALVAAEMRAVLTGGSAE